MSIPYSCSRTQHILALGFTRISEWQNPNWLHFHQVGKQLHKGRGEGHNSVSRADTTLPIGVNTVFSLCVFNVCLWEMRLIGPVRKDSVSMTGQPTVRAMDSPYSPYFSWLEWKTQTLAAGRPSFPQSVSALVKRPVVSTLMHVTLHSDTKWKMNEDITVREITANYKEQHRECNSLHCALFLIIQNMFMGCHFSVLVNIKTCSKRIKNVSWQCGEMGELWVMVMSDQHWLFVFLQMAWTAGVRVYPKFYASLLHQIAVNDGANWLTFISADLMLHLIDLHSR